MKKIGRKFMAKWLKFGRKDDISQVISFKIFDNWIIPFSIESGSLIKICSNLHLFLKRGFWKEGNFLKISSSTCLGNKTFFSSFEYHL